MTRIYTFSMAVAVVVIAQFHVTAADPIEELLTKVPAQANALVAIDVKGLYASPLAQREEWDKKNRLDVAGGSLPYPASAEAVLLAAHLEPGSLRSSWQLGLVMGDQQPALADLARQERGETQRLADTSVVFTAKNSIFVALSPRILGAYSPANRQDAARWIRFTQRGAAPATSPYLIQAVNDLKNGYHLVLAIDLTDAIDPTLARRFISQSPLVKEKKGDIDALTRALTGAKGVRIGIRVDQVIRATLAGDFSEDLKPYATLLPSLFLRALDDMGTELEEFPSASASVEGMSFLVTAQLSTTGLRRVLNLLPPVTNAMAVKEPPRPAAPAGQAKAPVAEDQATASKRFFASVNQWATDAHNAAEKKQDYVRAAQSYEKAAGQIDNLSVANVDDELLPFSTMVSSRLRSIAEALRGAVLEATALQNEKVTNTQLVHPGGYVGSQIGYWNPSFPNDPRYPQGIWVRPYIVPPQYSVQTNEPQIQARQAEILAKAARKRLDIWRQLQTEITLMKRKMTAKYRVDF